MRVILWALLECVYVGSMSLSPAKQYGGFAGVLSWASDMGRSPFSLTVGALNSYQWYGPMFGI